MHYSIAASGGACFNPAAVPGMTRAGSDGSVRNPSGHTGELTMNFAHMMAALILVISGLGGAAQADPNGHTTNFVRFAEGTFERTHGGAWLEFGNGSNEPRYTWRETHRDEWSIYLRDDSRQMNMQIDMHRDWVGLEWEGHPMQDQYPIVEADERINGRLVTQVGFSNGSFRMTRPGRWQEFDAAGRATNVWRETGRDSWSVYLRDQSRSMDMQIDMHRNWIRLAWPDHTMADWDRITASQ